MQREQGGVRSGRGDRGVDRAAASVRPMATAGAIWIMVSLIITVWPGLALAQAGGDTIYVKGSAPTTNVEILKEGCDEVVYKMAGSRQSVPATEVVDVRYGDSPSSFNRARSLVGSGRYQDALTEVERTLKSLSETSPKWLRPHALYTKGRALLGIAEGGDASRYGQAAETLEAFREVKEHKGHRLEPEVLRLLGEALIGAGEDAEAEKVYADLEKIECQGAWSIYGTYGRALIRFQAGDHGGARNLFLDVVQKAGVKAGTEALVGRARVMVGRAWLAEDSYDNAIDQFQKVIREGSARFAESPEFQGILAGAFNGMGDAYRTRAEKYGKEEDYKEAMVAYLRTVVLCSWPPDMRRHALLHGGRCGEKAGWPAVKKSLWDELKRVFPSSKEAKEAGM